MTRRRHDRRNGILSLLASVLLHVVVGSLLAWGAGRSGSADLALDATPEEERVKLGIEASRAITMTWIGFQEPTPHEAPMSTTEQAALARAETAGGSPHPSSPPAPAEATPAEQAPTPAPAGDWSELAPTIPIRVDAERMRDLLERLLEQAAMAAERTPAETADAGGETSAPGPGGPEQESAEQNSDREADPVARRRPLDVKPGQPLAAEGLEVKTTRPNWTLLMRASLRPRNPLVDITFGPDGTVRLVEFVRADGRVHSTGARDVDEVLKNAMYAWTAKGAAIDALDPADPEAGVTFRLRVILR